MILKIISPDGVKTVPVKRAHINAGLLSYQPYITRNIEMVDLSGVDAIEFEDSSVTDS